MKYSSEHPTVETPDLFVRCSSFPPFVWELMEKVYPNRLLATSRDLSAIGAAARLYATQCEGCGSRDHTCEHSDCGLSGAECGHPRTG